MNWNSNCIKLKQEFNHYNKNCKKNQDHMDDNWLCSK